MATAGSTRSIAMPRSASRKGRPLPNGAANVQWLERVGFDVQTGADSSFDIGLRRFSGFSPTPNGGGICGTISNPNLPNNPDYLPQVCSNISFAYHRKLGKRELYIAYGDPSQLFTTSQFIIKLIDHIGADKGS
jgi:hypothetical protein